MIGVALLGSTGSIGRSALNVLERHADEFRVVALAANRNAAELTAQLGAPSHPPAPCWSTRTPPGERPLDGGSVPAAPALLEAATHPDADIVINAVVGAAGLEATLAALEAGKRLALANKESLVAGGPLVREALHAAAGRTGPGRQRAQRHPAVHERAPKRTSDAFGA
jgi:1-deoxy-D-xylulose-5-phosphate reductoisomerase